MAEYTDLVHNSRASCSIAAVHREYEVAINAVSDGCAGIFLRETRTNADAPRVGLGISENKKIIPRKTE